MSTAVTSPRRTTAPKVGIVSLGCPKALVDSERILTQLRSEGYKTSPTYEAADVVIVNTCGFIDSAVQESLDAIGEAMAENGKVIVTGCLGAKKNLILEKYPDVLSISGPQDYVSVMDAVHAPEGGHGVHQHVLQPDHEVERHDGEQGFEPQGQFDQGQHPPVAGACECCNVARAM